MTILESDDFIPVNTSWGDIELMLILGEQHGSIMLNISQPIFFWGGDRFPLQMTKCAGLWTPRFFEPNQ